MPSDSYLDFQVRVNEALQLVALGLKAEATVASIFARSSVVLATAAVERYMNDVLSEVCREFSKERWTDMTVGRQRHLLKHLALSMTERGQSFVGGKCGPRECASLIEFIRQCGLALDNPASWDDYSRFGVFGRKATAPEKINGALRDFDDDGRDFLAFLNLAHPDQPGLLRGFTALTDARHSVAHAESDRAEMSAGDCRVWISAAVAVVVYVDIFLGFAPDGWSGRLIRTLLVGPQAALPEAPVAD